MIFIVLAGITVFASQFLSRLTNGNRSGILDHAAEDAVREIVKSR